MLSEAYNVRKIMIATGYTDLRKGIEGLSELVFSNYHLNPAEKDVLFLFWARELTASKDSSGKAMVFSSYISVSRLGASPGPEAGRKQRNPQGNSIIF